MIQAVLFDLDGTLADTALDLGGALNTLLARHGLPAKSMDEIRTQASHGAAGLIKLGAGITPMPDGAPNTSTNTTAATPKTPSSLTA